MAFISIEVSVVVTAGLMVVGFFLDHFRHRTSNNIFISLHNFLGSRTLLQYTIGRMQLTKNNNDLFQVWAVLLVTLQYSIRALRPSGIYGKYNPLQDIMTSFWTANLLGTRATDLQFPLWFLWFLNSFRIVLGFVDIELKPRRHKGNIELLTEYMRTEHRVLPQTGSDFMHGYNYLVWGEHNQEIKVQPPRYRVQMTVKKERKFITIPKIWQSIEQEKFRELCLSFALFKLIRRRFYDYPIHEARQQKTKEFVLYGLLGNSSTDYERAFRIIKAEVAFLVDFFCTRYASTFAVGFPKKKFILSILVITVIFYLGYVVFLHHADLIDHKLSKSELMVTGVILFCVLAKEIWEIVNYLMSDWTKVVMLSKYVENTWWMRCPVIVTPMTALCQKRLVRQWHNNLWQYNILQSFRMDPKNPAANYINRNRMSMKRSPGGKLNPKVKLPSNVKQAIGESMKNLLSNNNNYLESYLSNAASSVNLNEKGIIALVNDMKSNASKILVWHIATCYCEINLSTLRNNESPIKLNIDSPFFIENLDSHADGLQSHYEAATAISQYAAYLLAYSGYLVPSRCGMISTGLLFSIRFNIWKGLRRSRSWSEVLNALNQLIEIDKGRAESAEEAGGLQGGEGGAADGGLQGGEGAAAYGGGEEEGEEGEEQGEELVIEEQGEQIVVEEEGEEQGAEMVIEDEGEEQREEIVIEEQGEGEEQREDIGREEEDERGRESEAYRILKQGIKLGRKLMEMTADNNTRWLFLERFWAGYLLYLAASVSPGHHKQSLSTGGEFLTHVWALLSHAGILGGTDQQQAVDGDSTVYYDAHSHLEGEDYD